MTTQDQPTVDTIDDAIEQAITRYDIADAAIAEMADVYLPLAIDGVNDADGEEKVRLARKHVRDIRLQVEGTRKELKADSLKFGRAVDAEAKRIAALLEPIESHLVGEQERVKADRAAIEEARLEAERAKLDERVARLADFGASLPIEVLETMGEPEFQLALSREKDAHRERVEREAADQAEREAEAMRLARERAELEEARARLEAERAELAEREAAMAPPEPVPDPEPTAEPAPADDAIERPAPRKTATRADPVFVVITAVPDPEGDRAFDNLALCIPTHVAVGHEGTDVVPIADATIDPGVLLSLRAPVFALGEILVTDGDREIAGRGRKPSKWGVSFERYDDINEARMRAEEAMEGHD